jgi:hypothetical protein
MSRFCTRCGSELQPGDLYCGECGQSVPGAAGDPDEPTQASPAAQPQEEDFFADWDRGIPAVPPEPPPRPDEAGTESIPTARPHDTAVLPTAPPQTPYLPPGGHPPPAGPPGPAAAQAHPRPAPQGFPLGAAFALLGALAVVVSALLPWTSPVSFAGPLEPRDIPFTILLDPAPTLECVPSCPDPGPNLGLVLLGAGLAGALVALLTMVAPILKFLRRIIGLLTLGLVGVFVFRIVQLLLVIGEVDRIWQELGVGVYVAAAGAFTQMVAGKWFRR